MLSGRAFPAYVRGGAQEEKVPVSPRQLPEAGHRGPSRGWARGGGLAALPGRRSAPAQATAGRPGGGLLDQGLGPGQVSLRSGSISCIAASTWWIA